MKQASVGPKPSFDVTTIGAATRDAFAMSRAFERRVDRNAPDGFDACLPLGAKIELDQLVFQTGGGGTNAAVTFARFGLKTACVSRIGTDAGGREVRTELEAEGVDTRFFQLDTKQQTGYSIILVAGPGSRAILTARGASSHLDAKQIDWKKLSSSWFYLSNLGGNAELLKSIFVQAKANRTHVAWNPGGAEIEMGSRKLLPYLMQTDLLIMNREEAAELAGCSPRDLEKIIQKISPLPRQAFVLTDGPKGAYAVSRGATWFVSVLKGKIINTTGAGDAFGSAFTASILKDGDIERALKTATLNAHGVVTHMGAKTGILKGIRSPRELASVKVTLRS